MQKEMSLVEVDQGMLNRLRALRLWHWLEYLSVSKEINDKFDSAINKALRLAANNHMIAVQTLNDFFSNWRYRRKRPSKFISQ